MSFHLDYLLALPGVRVETCTQVEGKIFLGLSILSEGIDFLDVKRRHTQRYEQNIYERVKQSSMEQIGREEGLSYDEIKGIFEQVIKRKKTNWQLTKRISIDEISMRKGQGNFVTVVSDICEGNLIEMIDS